MCRCQPLHTGGSEQMQSVLGFEAERVKARANSKSHGLKLNKALVLVRAELKVLPLLVHFLLFAVNHLLHLLRLLVYIDDATSADRLGIAILARGVAQDVIEGLDAGLWGHLEPIFGSDVTARYGLAIDFLCALRFACIWTRPVVLCLRHQLLQVLRHGDGCEWEAGLGREEEVGGEGYHSKKKEQLEDGRNG